MYNKDVDINDRLQMLMPYENVIHDIKTPMTIIFANIQLIEAMEDLPIAAIKSVEMIKNNWYKAMKLINDVNDTAKLNSGHLQPKIANWNVSNIVKDITETTKYFSGRKNIEVTFHSDMAEEIVAIDKNMMERILLNLLSNAIKFTQYGGKVEVHLCNKKEHFEVIVKDNGQGIEEFNVDEIFQRYKTSNTAVGNGIGLSIVKEMTKVLNGKVSASSKIGEGTMIKVEFPLYRLDMDNSDLPLYDDFYQDNIVQIELSDNDYI